MSTKIKYVVYPGWTEYKGEPVYRNAEMIMRLCRINPAQAVVIDSRCHESWIGWCKDTLAKLIPLYPNDIPEKKLEEINNLRLKVLNFPWKKVRSQKKLTQIEIAKEMKISTNEYKELEQGIRMPSLDKLTNLLTFLNFK